MLQIGRYCYKLNRVSDYYRYLQVVTDSNRLLHLTETETKMFLISMSRPVNLVRIWYMKNCWDWDSSRLKNFIYFETKTYQQLENLKMMRLIKTGKYYCQDRLAKTRQKILRLRLDEKSCWYLHLQKFDQQAGLC